MFRTSFLVGVLNLLLLSGNAPAATPVTFELPMASPAIVAYAPNGKQIAVGGLETLGGAHKRRSGSTHRCGGWEAARHSAALRHDQNRKSAAPAP